VPDSIREEFVNVGVIVVDAGGAYSRLKITDELENRLRCVGALRYAHQVESFFGDLAATYDVAGAQLIAELRTHPPLEPRLLADMAGRFASIIRFTPARVFLAADPNEAFDDLYQRHVRRVRERVTTTHEPYREPERERRTLRDAFLSELRRQRNFSDSRIRVDQPFAGLRAHHWVDVVIVNGPTGPSALAHSLPFNALEEKDIYVHRGTILDAAIDSAPNTTRIALYNDPPAGRESLLRETAAIFQDQAIQLFRRPDLQLAAQQFDAKLLSSE
jgi:hypothetical protein